MNTINNTYEAMVSLATPYYGTTLRPNGSPERVYIKFVANPTTGKFNQTGLCVWDPKKLPDLPSWLSKQGIKTLLCNNKPIESDNSFSAAGITIFRKQWGDFQEIVGDWTTQITPGGDVLAA